MSRFTSNQTVLDAVTATATSGAQDVSMRTKMSLQFTAAAITSGNGVFTVDVSNDGTNWVAYNRLTTNVTNTNGQSDTRVASVTLSSNTSAIVFFPLGDYFRYIRVTCTRTTDGTYTATLQTID
jgi:hypothetical protein